MTKYDRGKERRREEDEASTRLRDAEAQTLTREHARPFLSSFRLARATESPSLASAGVNPSLRPTLRGWLAPDRG